MVKQVAQDWASGKLLPIWNKESPIRTHFIKIWPLIPVEDLSS